MQKTELTNEPIFETKHTYAIVSGWLILPALYSFFVLLRGAIMIGFVNPFELSGYDIIIYSVDAFFFLYLIPIYFVWFKRKQILPKLMIGFFIIYALSIIPYYFAGAGIDFITIIISIVWTLYFLRSKRVQQTFVH